MLNNCGTFYPSEGKPVFGVQSGWLCFVCDGKKKGVPDSADIAFIYLQSYRTRADKKLKELLDAGMKKASAVKECSTLEYGNEELTRIQCPAIDFDEEGCFSDVFHAFIKKSTRKANEMCDCEFKNDESCITTAWAGETRTTISLNLWI